MNDKNYNKETFINDLKECFAQTGIIYQIAEHPLEIADINLVDDDHFSIMGCGNLKIEEVESVLFKKYSGDSVNDNYIEITMEDGCVIILFQNKEENLYQITVSDVNESICGNELELLDLNFNRKMALANEDHMYIKNLYYA